MSIKELMNLPSFDKAVKEISFANNLHREFSREEIISSLNSGKWVNGILAELTKSLYDDGVCLKVWYTKEYYCCISC